MEFRDLPERWRGGRALLNFTGEKGSGREDMKIIEHPPYFGFIVEDMATQQKVKRWWDVVHGPGDNAEKETSNAGARNTDGIIIDISRKGYSGRRSTFHALASGRCLFSNYLR